MSVACITRNIVQTSRIPTNDVVASTRQTTIGGGAQTSRIPFSNVVCATSTRSSVVASSCNTMTGVSTVVIAATQQVSQIVVTMTVTGYATFVNTLRETVCTTGPTPLPPSITTPTVTRDSYTPPTPTPSTIDLPPYSDPPSTSSVSLTTPVTASRSLVSSQSIWQSTVGPTDDPASLSSLAAQDQPTATSTSNVPIAPVVGGVIGGVGGALVLGLLMYFLLLKRSKRTTTSSRSYNTDSLYGQAQADPRHYEYTAVQVDQTYPGQVSVQGDHVVSQFRPVDPFTDQERYYPNPQQPQGQFVPTGLANYTGAGAVTGGAYAAVAGHSPQSSLSGPQRGSLYATTGSPSSLGSAAPMVGGHMRQPPLGAAQPHYRGLAEPSDSSRFGYF